jgi:hypothetical protein
MIGRRDRGEREESPGKAGMGAVAGDPETIDDLGPAGAMEVGMGGAGGIFGRDGAPAALQRLHEGRIQGGVEITNEPEGGLLANGGQNSLEEFRQGGNFEAPEPG